MDYFIQTVILTINPNKQVLGIQYTNKIVRFELEPRIDNLLDFLNARPTMGTFNSKEKRKGRHEVSISSYKYLMVTL